jgi:hypothetical protein
MKLRTDIGRYSFINRTIKNWNLVPAETLGSFSCKPMTFINRVGKAIINWEIKRSINVAKIV